MHSKVVPNITALLMLNQTQHEALKHDIITKGIG